MRTTYRNATWNSTSNRFDFPQTPSRIMISLWPAGLSTNGQGTIDWAGGLVDWNSPDMANGYYYANLQEVTVECYKPPAGAKVSGSKAYQYTDASMTNNTVAIRHLCRGSTSRPLGRSTATPTVGSSSSIWRVL